MPSSTTEPLAEIGVAPLPPGLPLADLHVHAEADARLDRVLARREGRPAHDWEECRRSLAGTPAGMPRLLAMGGERCREPEVVDALESDSEVLVARIADLLEEGAAGGAVFIEARFGSATILISEFMARFREAERRVRERYPRLRAEAILSGLWPGRNERAAAIFERCLEAAAEGLSGIDFIPIPYDTEAQWGAAYRWAERAAAAGLGITTHAGEFSTANIAAALRVPGLTRIGHATHAATDPALLQALALSGVTLECSLTCNVLLGAVASYAAHPIRRFLDLGIPVALATDDPVKLGTTIDREYAIAGAMGFTTAELLAFTGNAVAAAFLSPARRSAIEQEIAAWTAAQ